MGILAVDSIRSRTVAPVTVSDDLNVTGVSTVGVLTATSVVVGSAVTANSSGIIAGLVTATTFSGAFNGTTGTFSGDVSIGGTLTYEDVERVDATGLSTFREGLNVGSPTGVGGTFDPAGGLSAGIGSFSSDLNIADKIVHLGDTNTTIRFPSADTITAETGGTERVRITSTGLMGLGTNSPSDALEISHASDPAIRLHYGTNSGYSVLGIDNANNLTFDVDASGAASSSFCNFKIDGSERMRIDSNGRVGIGESSSIDARLHVNSGTDNATLFLESTDGDVNLCMADNAGSCRLLQAGGALAVRTGGNANAFGTGDSERMRIDSAGRLLLGTTTSGFSAGDNLTIADTGHCGISIRSGTSNEGNLFFSDGTSGDDQIRGYVQYNHSNNNLILATNAVTALTLDTSQNATFAGTVTTAGFSVDGKSTQVAETLSAASTITINCSTGNYFTLTAGQNTTFAFSNVPSSGNVYVLMLQVAVATYSLTWPAAVKWSSTTGGAAPTLTANKVTNFVLVTSDGGTIWRASANTDYAS